MKRLILGFAATAALALGALSATDALAASNHGHGQVSVTSASTGYGFADGSVRFLK